MAQCALFGRVVWARRAPSRQGQWRAPRCGCGRPADTPVSRCVRNRLGCAGSGDQARPRSPNARAPAVPAAQCRTLSRPPVHADLRHRGGARALPRMGAGLRRPVEIRHARLLRLRRVRASRRLARRQVEPRRHDEHLFRRHRSCRHCHVVCAHAARDRHRPLRDRGIRRHLSPRRPRHRRGEMEEHRHAHRRQRRVGQPGRCQRGAPHRLFHRPRRLACGLRHARHRVDSGRHCLCGPDVGARSATPSIA